MAYNSYFPATYQPVYYNNAISPYYQQLQQQQMIQQAQQAQQQTQQPAIQQSGFVLVQSEQEARAYPVAPGNSVTFKDERQPYCYVKTMGFNQLDRPVFEKYRLVKEESPQEAPESLVTKDSVGEGSNTIYALKSDLTSLWDAINELREKTTVKVEREENKHDDE